MSDADRELELTELLEEVRRIDVLEVRASSTIRRYEYQPPEEGDDENFVKLGANEETREPARGRFRLFGIPNAF